MRKKSIRLREILIILNHDSNFKTHHCEYVDRSRIVTNIHFEATAKGNLPHAFASVDQVMLLAKRELVPHRRR